MELRKLSRFDYKELHSSGSKVPVSSDPPTAAASMGSEKVFGQLNGLLFQLEEIVDDFREPGSKTLTVVQGWFEELKQLRVNVFSLNAELKALKGTDYDEVTVGEPVKQKLKDSKTCLNEMQLKIAELKEENSKASIASENEEKLRKAGELNGRKFAYEKILEEIVTLINQLVIKYDISHDDERLTREIVLRRKEMKESYASDHARIKVLMDRLLEFTDVVIDGKEKVINSQLDKLSNLNMCKMDFEEKLRCDLENFDLTDEKLKLATQTKVNIGKFTGSFEKGMDFYTFQSKFLRAYAKYPKTLLVEWLTNNHLDGKAKECVGTLNDIDEIWSRLRNNFGNTELLLEYQFKKLYQLGTMRNLKSFETKRHFMQSLFNAVQDVGDIASEHGLKGELQYGSQLQKIVGMLDQHMQNSWYKLLADEDIAKPARWDRLLTFLTAELKIIQIRAAEANESMESKDNRDKNLDKDKDKPKPKFGVGSLGAVLHTSDKCSLCDDKHSNPNSTFIACKKFLTMTCNQRGNLVRRKKYCLQCVDGRTKHFDPNHECSDRWICRNESHEKFQKKLHFLLCGRHVDDAENKTMYETFKIEVLTAEWQRKLHSSIYITRHQFYHAEKTDEVAIEKEIDILGSNAEYPDPRQYGTPTYILQPYLFNDRIFNLMFDTGCFGFVCRQDAVDALPETHKENTRPGPITISGVGCNLVESSYGEYTVKIPAHDGRLVKFTGVALKIITGTMPPYPVREVRKTIVADYLKQVKGGKAADLPQVPLLVGGETDMLIGLMYNYFQPRLMHILPTGLAIYQSMFVGVDKTRGCIGGSHELFSQCERQFLETSSNVAQFKVFLQQQIQLFNNGIRVCLDCDVFVNSEDSHAVNADHETVNRTVGQCLDDGCHVVSKECAGSPSGEKVLLVGNSTPTDMAKFNMVHAYDIAVTDEDRPEIKPLILSIAMLPQTGKGEEVECPLQHCCEKCAKCPCSNGPLVLSVAKLKHAKKVEEAGSSIQYRCVKCRACPDCKKGDYIEDISFKQEMEQQMIDSSVHLDLESNTAIASLPFMMDPEEKLKPNLDRALKVYNGVVKKLNLNPDAKEAVILSERKLQDAGHVDWYDNLDAYQKKQISEGVCHHLIWRPVHNENSLTTPVRLVFDASAVTSSGYSLNDLLPKGINSINPLREIFIRWRTWKVAIHTDITKMYNVVKLLSQHWKFQMYLWEEELDPAKIPRDKLIKTLIYGVRSSGNQAQVAMRRTAELLKDAFPEAARSIVEDTYVDDCATGTVDHDKADSLSSDIVELLSHSGFGVKGFTRSGRPPLPALTKDGSSINVAGTKWHSEEDDLQLAMGEVNFAKKIRGKKIVTEDSAKVPEKLTMRICASKSAEVFDLIGLSLPVTSNFKIDMHELHLSSYDWGDKISEADREMWIGNFDMMNSLDTLRWRRAVVPPDAVSMEMELIGTGDASQKLAFSACYVRFQRKNGSLSCQLIFAKSNIVSNNKTLPRAELQAATLNTHATEIVKRSLKEYVKNTIYVLDSEIALYWIASTTKVLKPWVRNQVIEVRRFTDILQWFHIESGANPADIATRKGATLDDVSDTSEWIRGKPWMSRPIDDLCGDVLRDINQIKLHAEQLVEMNKETTKQENDLCCSGYIVHAGGSDYEEHSAMTVEKESDYEEHSAMTVEKVSKVPALRERLEFSNYLIDPNRHRFLVSVRVQAIVMRVARNWLSKINRCLVNFPVAKPSDDDINGQLVQTISEFAAVATSKEIENPMIVLSDLDVQHSLNYFFRKGTQELKSFVNPKHYANDVIEKDGIIYYAGRILNGAISLHGTDISGKMIDLSKRSFIVPIVDSGSPLALAIVNDIHWYDQTARHSGVETTIRTVMSIAHILQVRSLVKQFRKNCKRCRYLLMKTVEVSMSPASAQQLCVAPPFYITQTDICGPYLSFSTHNKRASLKVWILVFVCSTTGTTSLKIMEDYSTKQFLLGFSRFACELGYPKKLLTDEGGQLVSGCESVVLNITDIKGCLNREYGIEFSSSPVGGHNYHGRVERKIRTIRETLNKGMQNRRLSVLEWETTCSEVSNTINNLPVAIGNEVDDLENLDLITPNRLRLARNNNRSPVGPLDVTGRIDRLLQLKTDAFQAWWECWLTSALPKLVPTPKWFRNDEDIQIGDIVLFNRSEGSLIGDYRYGIVDNVSVSPDSKIRAVTVRYRNASENIDRKTFRAVRSLIIIHRVDEIDIMEELGEAALSVSAYYFSMEFSR